MEVRRGKRELEEIKAGTYNPIVLDIDLGLRVCVDEQRQRRGEERRGRGWKSVQHGRRKSREEESVW
jgi:hypothetical protein